LKVSFPDVKQFFSTEHLHWNMQMTGGISLSYCDTQWCFDALCLSVLVFVQFHFALWLLFMPAAVEMFWCYFRLPKCRWLTLNSSVTSENGLKIHQYQRLQENRISVLVGKLTLNHRSFKNYKVWNCQSWNGNPTLNHCLIIYISCSPSFLILTKCSSFSKLLKLSTVFFLHTILEQLLSFLNVEAFLEQDVFISISTSAFLQTFSAWVSARFASKFKTNERVGFILYNRTNYLHDFSALESKTSSKDTFVFLHILNII